MSRPDTYLDAYLDARYTYAVGRIRALETRLLDQPRIDRMVEARDAHQALVVLGQTDYKETASEVKEVLDFDTILERELRKVLNLISSLSHDPDLTDLFRLRYDFHNLKVLLKRRFLGQEATGDGLMDIGLTEPKEIARIISEEDFGKLPDILREAAGEASSRFKESRDPQLIDIILDRRYIEHICDRFAQSKNRFLIELLQMWVDLFNIKTLLRVKDLGKGREFFDEVYLSHGTLPKELFLRLYDQPLEKFPLAFAPTTYGKLVEEGIRCWQRTRSLSGLERVCDDYLLEFLKKTKYIVFGLEPLIGYLWAKENELKLIRIIMVGKLNNLPAEAIREHLRKVYV